MITVLNNIRMFERFKEEVNNPYYNNLLPDSVCLKKALEIIKDIEDKNVEIKEQILFVIYNNTSQIAISAKEYDIAEEMIDKAYEYTTRKTNKANLMWRECEMLFEQGYMDRSYSEYIRTLKFYNDAYLEDINYKPETSRNNICAIKYQIGTRFKNEYYMTECMLETIKLYKDGIVPSSEVELTYDEFKRVVSNIQMIIDVKSSLKLNKIVL